MTYESAKDPRLLLAERAIDGLQENFRQKLPIRLEISKPDLQKVLSGAKSTIMTVKYSYQSPSDLAKDENVLKLVTLGQRLLEQILHAKTPETPSNLALSRIEWSLRFLAKLADYLQDNIFTVGRSVDVKVARIQNVRPIKKSKGVLVVSQVHDGERALMVVTNLIHVKVGMNLAIAMVPPSEVGGVISEAMFVTDTVRPEPIGSILNETDINLGAIEDILREYLAKH
ncbi:MAG: hypothetical protein ACXAB4_04500 [Candidatus Hodarchaeales archaeon]|jgi:predicted RNA-binding protein with EMAP domain